MNDDSNVGYDDTGLTATATMATMTIETSDMVVVVMVESMEMTIVVEQTIAKEGKW